MSKSSSRKKKSSSSSSTSTETTTETTTQVEGIVSVEAKVESTSVTTSVLSSLILPFVQRSDRLDDPVDEIVGVGRMTAERLRSVGITKIKHLILMSPEELSRITGMDKERCESIISNARQYVGYREFITAYDLKKLFSSLRNRLKLHCDALDDLLGGGFRIGAIYEFVGEFGVGKSQICYQASVTVQLPPEQGGLNGAVLFIDTEGTFMPDRIEVIAKRFKLDPEQVLNNILYKRAFTTDDILDVVTKLPLISDEFASSHGRRIKLVVIDSFVAPFRAEYVGRENLPARAQKMSKILQKLLLYLTLEGAVGIITNHVQAQPDIRMTSDSLEPGKKPWGGHTLAHLATYRIWLFRESRYREKGEKRVAKIFDAADLPSKEATFLITDEGLM